MLLAIITGSGANVLRWQDADAAGSAEANAVLTVAASSVTAAAACVAGEAFAATLALETGVDVKIVSEQLGHSTTRITQDLYQHDRLQVHEDSAEKIRKLLPERVTRAQVAR